MTPNASLNFAGTSCPQMDPAHNRHLARACGVIDVQLTALHAASSGPDRQTGVADALSALLGASAELLADAAPHALANAPNRQKLEAYDPHTCMISDDALAGLVAGHLGAVLAAAAVRLPLTHFFTALPELHAHLKATVARHLARDPGRGLGFVVSLSMRLTAAIGAGDTQAAREAVQTLRGALATPAPKRGRPRRTLRH